MVVDGRHTENALPPQLERAYLQNHGERFDDEDSTNKKQQNLLLDDDRYRAQSSAKRERPDIAHENFRWVGVVPKEAKGGADQGAAKYGQFADARNVLNFEVRGPARVAADVGQHGERARGDDGAADG